MQQTISPRWVADRPFHATSISTRKRPTTSEIDSSLPCGVEDFAFYGRKKLFSEKLLHSKKMKKLEQSDRKTTSSWEGAFN